MLNGVRVLNGCQRSLQDRQLLPRLQSAEALCRFDYARSGPVQGHACVAPSLDVAADPTDRTVHVLDDVRAGERSAELATADLGA